MQQLMLTINAFVEDTSVVVVVAYLLTRGRVLQLLLSEHRGRSRDSILAGVLLGAAGATEYLFPNQRYPYVPQTLFTTFAALAGGPRVGVTAALVVLIAGIPAMAARPEELFALGLAVSMSVLVGWGVRRWTNAGVIPARRLGAALTAGVAAQAGAVAMHQALARVYGLQIALTPELIGAAANGLGVLLLVVVVNEATVRTNAEQHRADAEQLRTVAVQHQLVALQARVHPHFLFNTLTSIAALCAIAPERAEEATVLLGELMRRALEADPAAPVPLTDEISYVGRFVAIERLRFGDRLHVDWKIDVGVDTASTYVPPFCLLTLAENAVQHGVSTRTGPAVLEFSVCGRRDRAWVLCAVRDNGSGMAPAGRRSALGAVQTGRPHGLTLLDQQLRLLYGVRSRVRLFSRPDAGTLAAFRVPAGGRA
jgi:hypothetical protein